MYSSGHNISGFYLTFVTPLSTTFQLYRGGQIYWWRKPEYLEKTTDLWQAIWPKRMYSSGHNISGFYLTFVICVDFSSHDLNDRVSYCHHSVSVDHWYCTTSIFVNLKCCGHSNTFFLVIWLLTIFWMNVRLSNNLTMWFQRDWNVECLKRE
jgi:hypothetical protein